MLDFMIATPKRHIIARNRVFWHILRQNRSRGLGSSELQEPKKRKNGEKKLTRFGAQSHACAETKPGLIVTNFCTGVGVHDVITSANFYDCRLWGGGGSNFGFLH